MKWVTIAMALALSASAVGTAETSLVGCAPAHQAPASGRTAFDWQTTRGARHPLVGQFYDPTAKREVPHDEVLSRMAKARFVLLGEKHDNPDHHRFEAAALAHLADDRSIALVMEMIPHDKQAALDATLAPPHIAVPDDIAKSVDWDKSGWPPFAEYRPVFEVVIGSGIKLYGGDLVPASAHAIAHHGTEALDPDLMTNFHLSTPLPADQEAALEKEIGDVHCGMLPPAFVPNMALAQRARDATLAQTMIAANLQPGRDPDKPLQAVVLVSGDGHARNDRAVPKLLRDQGIPPSGIFSIGMLEVDDARSSPADYASEFGTTTLPFDVVWFTPRANDDDPCAQMKMPSK